MADLTCVLLSTLISIKPLIYMSPVIHAWSVQGLFAALPNNHFFFVLLKHLIKTIETEAQ